MGNREICAQDTQISDAQKDVFEKSQIPKSIYKIDIVERVIIGGYKPRMYLLDFPLEQKLS